MTTFNYVTIYVILFNNKRVKFLNIYPAVSYSDWLRLYRDLATLSAM